MSRFLVLNNFCAYCSNLVQNPSLITLITRIRGITPSIFIMWNFPVSTITFVKCLEQI